VTVIAIRDPSLVVLIGAAGSGKSTFAARLFDPSEVLSSDGYRALIAGDPADQTVTRAAFGRLHRDLARRLQQGHLSVVDATNIERSARLALLRRASSAGLPAVAIVFDLPADVVLARNAARSERMVDEHVVRDHLDRLRPAIDWPMSHLASEGFSQVVLLRDQVEIDGTTIVRQTG
jgi:protein phosphatase